MPRPEAAQAARWQLLTGKDHSVFSHEHVFLSRCPVNRVDPSTILPFLAAHRKEGKGIHWLPCETSVLRRDAGLLDACGRGGSQGASAGQSGGPWVRACPQRPGGSLPPLPQLGVTSTILGSVGRWSRRCSSACLGRRQGGYLCLESYCQSNLPTTHVNGAQLGMAVASVGTPSRASDSAWVENPTCSPASLPWPGSSREHSSCSKSAGKAASFPRLWGQL